jgi:muconolactone D-isomerase
MDVRPPHDIDPARLEALKAEEKERSQALQRQGKWPHLWRIAGEYANVSILDVADHDELHALLSSLPLYPFMAIEVTPLARHPSAI